MISLKWINTYLEHIDIFSYAIIIQWFSRIISVDCLFIVSLFFYKIYQLYMYLIEYLSHSLLLSNSLPGDMVSNHIFIMYSTVFIVYQNIKLIESLTKSEQKRKFPLLLKNPHLFITQILRLFYYIMVYKKNSHWLRTSTVQSTYNPRTVCVHL